MRLRHLMVAAGSTAALVLAPTAAGQHVAVASGCDTVTTDADTLSIGQIPIAATGSLAPGTGAPATVTVDNSAGVCVAGATVYLYFSGTAGGGASAASDSCPGGRLTPNWLACVTNGQGDIALWYTTPATLPNGGTDTVEAALRLDNASPVISTSYTYGALQVTGSGVRAEEGQAFAGTVATLTENGLPDASTFAARIDWGDGTTSSGTIAATPAALEVTGAHTYAEESGATPFVTRVTVTGPSGPSASGEGTAAVADAPLDASGASFSGHSGQALEDVQVAAFTDGDPGAAVTDYAATIAWGDGASSSGAVTSDGTGGFSVTGSHTYGRRGQYTVTTHVLDAGGAGVQASGTASVIGRR